MAQFDVYLNPSKHSKKTYPFILDIQHSLLDGLSTRIVVPLADCKQLKQAEMKGLTPKVRFDDMDLLIMTPQIASMPKKTLKQPIGTLVHLRHEIIAALDLAVTGL